MKKLYFPGIALFSLVLPLLVALIGFAIVSITKSSMIGDAPQLQATYDNDLALNAQLEQIQLKLKNKSPYVKQWQSLIKGESFGKLNQQMDQSIKAVSKTKSLSLTGSKRETPPNLRADSNVAACSYGLKGTYGEIQRCLTDLESKMPQTMVTKMKLSATPDNKLINFNVNFTAWEELD